MDYGMRGEDTRVARFISVDPLTKKYPMLTPYQFGSNCPISGGDMDGLEYYYGGDGSLLWKFGTSTQVKLVDDNFAKANSGNQRLTLGNVDPHSSSVGMTNEELNTRAFLGTIKQAKNKGNDPLNYKAANGMSKGKVQTFTEKSYADAPGDYAEHPGDVNSTGSSAAGAYQILEGSFKAYQNQSPDEIPDFSPVSQDKIAMKMIKYRKAGADVAIGDIDAASKKLTKRVGGEQFASLPGGSQQAVNLKKAKELFKKNVAKELHGNSGIATPVGKLTGH